MSTGRTLRMAETVLAIAIILLAAIVAPALADTDDAQAGGVPSLEVRYAVVKAKVGLTIDTISAITDLVPEASDLNDYAVILDDELEAMQLYITANDVIGFNAYIRNTIHPDLQAAHKAIITAKQQFKAWGVSKKTLKELKDLSKMYKAEYRVGKLVSQAAHGKKSIVLQDYLIKAGIDVQDNPSPTPVPSVEPTGTPTPTAEPTITPTPTAEPTITPTPTAEPTITPTPTVEPTGTPTPTPEPTASPTPTAT